MIEIPHASFDRLRMAFGRNRFAFDRPRMETLAAAYSSSPSRSARVPASVLEGESILPRMLLTCRWTV